VLNKMCPLQLLKVRLVALIARVLHADCLLADCVVDCVAIRVHGYGGSLTILALSGGDCIVVGVGRLNWGEVDCCCAWDIG